MTSIICRKSLASEGLHPKTPYWGFAPGLHGDFLPPDHLINHLPNSWICPSFECWRFRKAYKKMRALEMSWLRKLLGVSRFRNEVNRIRL